MKPPVTSALNIEINNSDEEELSDVAGLGPERARRLVDQRPFGSWDDVQKLEGFTQVVVESLQQAGAQLGPADAAARAVPSEEHRQQQQLEQRAGLDIEEGVLKDGRKGAGPERRPS